MAAIRHRVRVRMFLAGIWQDITIRTRQSDTITITRGRKDENTKTPPSTCTLTLDNSDGAFSMRNPLGPWYGELGQNNPIEVTKNLVTDTFSRTVASGLGTANTGQPWVKLAGASAAAVTLAGATLTQAPNDVNHWYVQGVSQVDARVTVEFSIATADITGDAVVPGGAFVRGGAGPESIYARVEISTSESISLGIRGSSGTLYAAQVTTGITHVAGQRLSVCIQADGETVTAKMWRTEDGEPQNWSRTATGVTRTSGFVGFRSSQNFSSTNNPLVVTYHSFVADSVRFVGEVSKLPAASDTTGRDQYVPIEAAGILRRLGQGTAPTLSAIKRGILSVSPVAYWPCEDGKDSTSITSATAGVAPMSIAIAPDLPDFAANDDFLCSKPLPTMSGTMWVGTLPDYDTSAGKIQARVLLSTPAGGIAADEILMSLRTDGTGAYWDLVQQTDGSLRVNIYNSGGTNIYLGDAIGFGLNGKKLRVSFDLEQLGSDVRWTIGTLEPNAVTASFFNDTVSGVTFGQCSAIYMNPFRNITDSAAGHVTFQNTITSLFEIKAQLDAHIGERALTRMRRLSTENSVPLTYVGLETDTATLGGQLVRTYLDLIREAGDGDAGTVYEQRGLLGVAYRNRTSSFSQTSRVTLDLAKFEVGTPFQPVDDDQATRNDITLKRAGGGEFRAVLETGRKSVLDPPDGAGRYDDTPEVSTKTELQLYDLAHWLLALGTVDEARYPNLKIDLDAPAVVTAGLEPSVLDLDIDDRVSIVNASRARIYDPIHQLVRGYTEVLGNYEHTFTLNLSPSSPFDLGALDDGSIRIPSGSSTLTAELAAGVTGAVSVTHADTHDVWTTAGGNFPLDIMIGGERITLSGISGSSSPQTFTISARAVNGVAKKHNAGSSVDVANPWRLGL